MKKDNLNPDLMIGDEVTVIDVDSSFGTMNTPERFKDYVVTAIKQSNQTQETYYDIKPINETDEELLGRMLAGGGMIRREHLYPTDTWMLRKGFLRGELEEEPNEIARTLSKARKHGVGTKFSKEAIKANPKRFRKYTRDKYIKEQQEINPELEVDDIVRVIDVDGEHGHMPERFGVYKVVRVGNVDLFFANNLENTIYYQIVPYPSTSTQFSELDIKSLYRGDTWIYVNVPMANKVDRKTIGEQVNPKEDEILTDKDEWLPDATPFTKLEANILKQLHKNLDRSELQRLTNTTPQRYNREGEKFWSIMKLFGIIPSNEVDDTRVSKYAKWALDNWTEDGDYGSIEEPIKEKLKWYDVDREETGSQVEYKSGNAEVLGFDEDDAGERADYDFYAWDGEMHTNDYGDYEQYDSEITNSVFLRMDESTEDYKSDPKVREMLFNYWVEHGPSLDPNNMKLLGYNMSNYDDRSVVWDNLKEYYGDEELNDIIYERLEGLHDSWSYEYIVTNAEWNGGDITLDILVNGDTQIPVTQESGGVIDMSLWDINENETGDYQNDDIYDEVRDSISSDIEEVLLKDLPVVMNLDYMDLSKPGTFESYVKENELEIIREEDDGYIDDMVYIDEPREKHIRRMDKDLGSLEGFPIENFKNVPPPTNESSKTEEEIGYLEDIPVDKNLVNSADEIRNHFSKFLSTKGLKYPKEELKPVMRGVTAIILKLKYHYNRPRPWQIAQEKGLELNAETLQSSSSPSYPSGHATQGRFIARYLANLYPEYVDELTQIGDDIAFSRNMAKVHYPSDSAFGKLLGDSMYDYVYQPQEELELQVNEQVMVDKGDMLKSDIFRILSNTFILTPTDHSEIKDSEGNYYGIYDIKQEEYVNMSDLIEGVLDFISYGVESGDFKEEDIQKGITAITDWVSLMMNQEKEYLN